MSTIRAAITAVNHYVPDKVLTNFDLEKMVETSDEWIRTRTGIQERHFTEEGETASTMAAEAAALIAQNCSTSFPLSPSACQVK